MASKPFESGSDSLGKPLWVLVGHHADRCSVVADLLSFGLENPETDILIVEPDSSPSEVVGFETTPEAIPLTCLLAPSQLEDGRLLSAVELEWLAIPGPVVVLVEPDMNEDRRLALLNAGADDLWTMSIYDAVLSARLRRFRQNEIAKRYLAADRRRLDKELVLTRTMQKQLFPTDETCQQVGDQHGIVIQSDVHPSSELGGDLWGLENLSQEAFAFFIADFTGHGMAAAVNTFRLHAIMADLSVSRSDPVAVLNEVNRTLLRLLPRGQYATFLYGCMDTKTRGMAYAAAGCPQPLVIYQGGRKVDLLDTRGLPVGISDKATYDLHHVDLSKAEALMIYSDVLIEVFTDSPESLGERLIPQPHDNLFNGLMACFHDEHPPPLADDLTAVWFGFKPA